MNAAILSEPPHYFVKPVQPSTPTFDREGTWLLRAVRRTSW